MTLQNRAFLKLVAAKTGETQRDTEKTMRAIFGTIAELVESGEHVHVPGFGSFHTRMGRPRLARNPQTGERLPLPETRKMHFRPSETLRERIAAVERRDADPV